MTFCPLIFVLEKNNVQVTVILVVAFTSFHVRKVELKKKFHKNKSNINKDKWGKLPCQQLESLLEIWRNH